jgi:hypothetical protein
LSQVSGSACTICGTRFSSWLVNKAKVEPKTVQSSLLVHYQVTNWWNALMWNIRGPF